MKGQDVVVAVLDTGCDTNHIDLKDRIIGGRNFTKDYEAIQMCILIITDMVLMLRERLPRLKMVSVY